MRLHDLSPPEGSNQDKQRKGRGRGAKKGESCGRGNKGQKKRNTVPNYFEGGQTPIYRLFPKRGFNPPNQETVEVVNVGSLDRFEDGAELTPETLDEEGLVSGDNPVKLLGDGSLDIKLTISIHAVSSSARDKVEDAGGTINILSTN